MAIAANAKLRTRALVAVLAALLITGVSACDAKSGPDARSGSPDTRQVTVIGSGKVQGTPDTLTANVAMEFVSGDVTAALSQSSQRQQAVIDALVGNKVDRKDITTTHVSVQPQTNADGTTIAYRASNAIDVKIRDITAASQLLALIANTGGDATRINSVSYSIEDDSQLVKDARAQAFNDAKNRYGFEHICHHKRGSLLVVWLLTCLALTIERLYRIRYLHRGTHPILQPITLWQILWLSLSRPMPVNTS